MGESVLPRAVQEAPRKARMAKPASGPTLWRLSVTSLVEDGDDMRATQEQLGHRDVKTTMIYTHVLNWGGKGVYGPIDRL